MHQLFLYLGDVEPFLCESEDIAPATRGKLLAFFSDPNKKAVLQIELAAIIDWGEPFVKATYKLEGDGPLALVCYEVIDTIRASVHTAYTPNIVAVADKLSGGVMHTKRLLLHHVHQCIKPGLDYFNHQLSSTLQGPLSAFKAAQFFSPYRLHEMQPACLFG